MKTELRTWQDVLHYNGTWWSLLAMPVIVTSLVTTLLYFIFLYIDAQTIWDGWELGNSGKEAHYCELNRMDELLRQPSNSWSNMAYFFFGMVCINLAIADRKRPPGQPINMVVDDPPISWWYGITLIFLCFGSFLFHASLTRRGQHIDMTGTYAVVALPALINIIRIAYVRRPYKPHVGIVVIVAGLIVNILFHMFKWMIDSSIVIPLLVLLVLSTTIAYHRLTKTKVPVLLMCLAFGSLIFAFIVRTMDVNKILCDPESILQGHALWHILAGLSVLLIYFVIRAERSADPATSLR